MPDQTKMMKTKTKIAVIDFETDPFKYGRDPKPFAGGFFDGTVYQDFWGPHCVEQLAQYCERQPDRLLIYAHNGGKFDFHFLIDRAVVNNPLTIINSRITKIGFGRHELRDSYAIFPFPLATYNKEEIDYAKFEADVREKHRDEILRYLKSDCVYLYELVAHFVERFGPMLTIGSTAIKELDKVHPIKKAQGDAAVEHDTRFRKFYFGGRVEAIEPGAHQGQFVSVDTNSMYPHVMRDFLHPSGQGYECSAGGMIDARGEVPGYEGRPYFARIVATNNRALPVRTKTGLTFKQEYGEFFACSHELRIALKRRLVKIEKVTELYMPLGITRFDTFVNKFSQEKIDAKLAGDAVAYLEAKYIQNSAYGKFATNPDNYFDWHIKRFNDPDPGHDKNCQCGKCPDWQPSIIYDDWEIWNVPSPKPRYFDVAVAASITSAARATLLDALCTVKRPMYCDTDGIICTDPGTLKLSDTELGAWKVEARGDMLSIAGKKMYALYNGAECVKMASKGAHLEPRDIFDLAAGRVIIWRNDAPTFKLGKPATYIERRIRKTA
jgi:hypothetical protein